MTERSTPANWAANTPPNGHTAPAEKIALTVELEQTHMKSIAGELVSVWALPFTVSFARGPVCLDDLRPLVRGCGQAAYVGRVVRLAAHEFDSFAVNFRAPNPHWLAQALANLERLQNAIAGVLVLAPERPALLVAGGTFGFPLNIAKLAP